MKPYIDFNIPNEKGESDYHDNDYYKIKKND